MLCTDCTALELSNTCCFIAPAEIERTPPARIVHRKGSAVDYEDAVSRVTTDMDTSACDSAACELKTAFAPSIGVLTDEHFIGKRERTTPHVDETPARTPEGN